MKRVIGVFVVCLLLVACGDNVKISSHEEGINAQLNVMDEMFTVLEGVEDEASAKAATDEIEALGKKLSEIAAQMNALPKPTAEEMKELASNVEITRRQQELFGTRMAKQLMKLAQYPELRNALSSALGKVEKVE